MSEKVPEIRNESGKNTLSGLIQIKAKVSRYVLQLIFPQYIFPIHEIFGKISEHKNITMRISVRDNTILSGVLESIAGSSLPEIHFEIYIRDWIKKSVREKVDTLQREGRNIHFLGGIKKDPIYGYTSLGEAVENMPTIIGEVFDTKTGNRILHFKEIEIEGETFFVTR